MADTVLPIAGRKSRRRAPQEPSMLVDRDLVAALAWCRLGGQLLGRPSDPGAFRRAEALGLLAHDPIWRTTAAGDGVLIALGLLAGSPAAPVHLVQVLWARSERYPTAQFVQAWSEAFADCFPEQRDAERAKAEYEHSQFDGGPWTFWTTFAELDAPLVAPDESETEPRS